MRRTGGMLMIDPRRFNELSNALSKRFFAGEAVLVLSKIKKQLPLSKDDLYFLAKIKDFFGSALATLNWAHKKLVVSEVFVRDTFSLHELAVAMLRVGKPRANFQKTMDKLMSIAIKLSPLQPIGARDLELLINIFTHLDCYYAERTADLLE